MKKFENEKMIDPEFCEMLSSASACLESDHHTGSNYHQCLVLRTVQGEQLTASFAADSVDELIEQECAFLSEREQFGKTAVKKIICVWKGNAVDLPPHRFTKELCTLNEENRNTEILLYAVSGAYVVKKLSDVIGSHI